MSCPEEWGRVESTLIRFIKEYARHERLYHQCEFHKDTESCYVSGSLGKMLEEYIKELKDSITDLARCIERSVVKK